MKKKIKVLHILNLVGGVEICFRQICENIDTSIIETSIVCQKIVNKSKLVTSKGKEIISFSIPIAREINPIFDLFSIIKLIFCILYFYINSIFYCERPFDWIIYN